jgi:hypothetical protein
MLENRKSNFQNNYMDRVLSSQNYQDMKFKVDKDIVLVKDKLGELQKAIPPFRLYIQKEVPMLEISLSTIGNQTVKLKRKS